MITVRYEINFDIVASKIFKNSLVQFTGIATREKFLSHDLVRGLRDAVRRRLPEKLRTDSWIFLHDNAPAHRPVLIEDLVAKNNVTTLDYLPYSPDLASADFYLFS